MGNILRKFYNNYFGKKEIKILMVGLDNTGKTSILYKLKFGELIQTEPSICYHTEILEHNNIIYTIWDICGLVNTRHLRRHYYHYTKNVIFVIDSSNKERIEEAREELFKIISEYGDLINDAKFLILANKQDLPDAMNKEKLIEKLQINSLSEKIIWHFQNASAFTGEGLYESLNWFAKFKN